MDLINVDTTVAQSLIFDTIQSEKERADRTKRAWAAYHGEPPQQIPVPTGGRNDNVTIGYPRTIVDKGVAFLFGEDIQVTVPDNPEATLMLEEAWRQNRKMLTLQKLALNGAITGHFFAKLQIQDGLPHPRIIVIDPSYVTVSWDPEDIDTVLAYRIQWTIIQRDNKPAVRRQEIVRDGQAWTITDLISDTSDGRFRVIAENSWPFPWPPIVDGQNLPQPNEYWGLSDLEIDVLDLSEAIDRVLSHINKIIRIHAHPKTVSKGLIKEQLKTLSMGSDDVLMLPSMDADLYTLEMQSDLKASLDTYRELKAALHEVTRVPEVATGKLDSVGQLSGLALSILYQPLIEKTDGKRRTYGYVIELLSERILELAGRKDLTVQIEWPQLLPSDPKEEASTLLLHQQLGVVSEETIARKLGYDWDAEHQRIEEERTSTADVLTTAFDRGKVL